MPYFASLLNQKTVFIEDKCNLACLNCNIGGYPANSFLLKYIRPSLLHETVNVVGGEPLQSSNLLSSLSQIKRLDKYCRVWTNGLMIPSILKNIESYVDEFVIYCPTHHPESYRYLTGHDQFHELKAVLDFLEESFNGVITLSIPVELDTLPYLQELYDAFYNYPVRFLIHYNRLGSFDKESLAYLRRFRHVTRCAVVASSDYSLYSCKGYPYATDNYLQRIRYSFLEWGQWFLHRRGPMALLKSVLG